MRYYLLAFFVLFVNIACSQSPTPVKPTTVATMPIVVQPIDPAHRIENPYYSRWNKFPVGTSATFDETTESSGKKQTVQTFYTLALKSEDYVEVLVTGNSYDANGQLNSVEPMTLRQFHWIPKPKDNKDPRQPAGTYATGEETITVNGKAYKTTWFKSKGHVEAGETDTQVWYCDDVPGALVQSVHKIAAAQKTVTAQILSIMKKP